MTKEQLVLEILNQLQEGILAVDEREDIIFFNNSACGILGVEKDAVLYKNVVDTIPNTRLHVILRTGVSELDRLQNLGNKVIITSRFPIRNEENEIVASVAVFRDVTTVQKLAEEVTNLREIEAMLTSVIDSTTDAISVADEEGRIVMVNRAYTKITGLTPREVIGKPATIDIAEGESLHIKCAREKKPILNVKMQVGQNKKDVIASVTPIFVKNDFKGSVGVIHDISEIQNLLNELEATKRLLKKEKARHTFNDIVAVSSAMQNVIKQSQKAAETKVNILIQGEVGVGKEVLAQAIHNSSERSSKPYLKINLGLVMPDKQEEFLFGERSYFIKADGGTLFIENIQSATPFVQSKILKYLKDNEFDSQCYDYKPDVRLIFSSPDDLKTLSSIGKFSSEIYYKISVVTINIPPLRERKEDIPALAKQILHALNQKYGRIIYDFTEDSLSKLLNYNWLGNIRELENLIDRAILNLGPADRIITSAHIPDIVESNERSTGNIKELLDEYEKKIIIEMLEVCHGNKTEAAKRLGLTVRNLYYKLDRYGIKS